MKNKFITTALTIALSAMSLASYGQFYVGGSFGLGVNGGKTKIDGTTTDKPKTTAFNLSPTVGYYLGERWSVAGRLSFTHSSSESEMAGITEKIIVNGWGLTPFVRYKFISFGKFSFVGEAGVRMSGSKEKTKDDKTTVDGVRTFDIGFYVTPLITFRANDHWILGMSSNLASIAFGTKTSTITFAGDKVKDSENYFEFGADLNDVFGTLGDVQIGVLYKF